jgi:hypothetical protein
VNADLTKGVPLALEAGWTMATLYGVLGRHGTRRGLPTINELDEADRTGLEVARLGNLLPKLTSCLSDLGTSATLSTDSLEGLSTKEALREQLLKLNLEILTALAETGQELEIAYQVGRSLRDTSNPPADDPSEGASVLGAMQAELGHERVAKLQGWLSLLAPFLGVVATSVVSISIGRWSSYCSAALDTQAPGELKTNTDEARGKEALRAHSYLLDQGGVWLNVLLGIQSTEGLLTPEAYVAAGEAALSRSARIVRRVVLHYWFAFALGLVATAVILFMAVHNLKGAGRVWTSIATILGALGVSAKGIGSAIAKLSKDAERPIYKQEQTDAIAWAITVLPPRIKLNHCGVRNLRRAGILRSTPLGL